MGAIEHDTLDMASTILEELKKFEKVKYPEFKNLDKNSLVQEILKKDASNRTIRKIGIYRA